VERRDPHAIGVGTNEINDASAHLVSRLIREGDRHDLVGASVTGRQYVGNTPRENAGLSRAGSGDDQQWSSALGDGGDLRGGQAFKKRRGVESSRRIARTSSPQ
jgi:hypothetical protein